MCFGIVRLKTTLKISHQVCPLRDRREQVVAVAGHKVEIVEEKEFEKEGVQLIFLLYLSFLIFTHEWMFGMVIKTIK